MGDFGHFLLFQIKVSSENRGEGGSGGWENEVDGLKFDPRSYVLDLDCGVAIRKWGVQPPNPLPPPTILVVYILSMLGYASDLHKV